MSRAEALFVELIGAERRLLAESISHFRAALEAQESSLIVRSRDVLLSRILELSRASSKQ